MVGFFFLAGTDTGVRLAKAGYAVHGMDYEGHGKSSGLAGYVPSFDDLVHDLSEHYSNVCGKIKIDQFCLPLFFWILLKFLSSK